MNNNQDQAAPAQEHDLQYIKPLPRPLPVWFEVTNDDTGESRHVIDYGAGFQNTTGFLQWGKDF